MIQSTLYAASSRSCAKRSRNFTIRENRSSTTVVSTLCVSAMRQQDSQSRQSIVLENTSRLQLEATVARERPVLLARKSIRTAGQRNPPRTKVWNSEGVNVFEFVPAGPTQNEQLSNGH